MLAAADAWLTILKPPRDCKQAERDGFPTCRGYKESMQGVRRKLLQRTAKAGGLLYVAEMHGGSIHHKMDHLVCFLPGAPCSMQMPSAKALLTRCPSEV